MRCAKASFQREGQCCKYEEQLTRLDPACDYRVGNYLQSFRYWQQHDFLVRQKIVFSDEIKDKVSAIVGALRKQYNGSKLVGMHLRRGDLGSKHNFDLGYRAATPLFVQKSVVFFRQLFPDIAFVVSSDSIDWCKKHFPNGTRVHFLEKNKPVIDLAVLAAMDHTAISFGTFSWWIGYLNTGVTVYMKDFIIAGTYIGKQFNPEGKDYIYPGWVPL